MSKKKRDAVADAIKQLRDDYSDEDWSSLDQDDLYGEYESIIDALLYEPEYAHYGYLEENGHDTCDDAELILERLVFDAISKTQRKGKRHTCDPYYDDAFQGYDCMSKVDQT